MTPHTHVSLIRPEEVAKILGCSVVYIYKLAQRSELPSYAFVGMVQGPQILRDGKDPPVRHRRSFRS